LLGGEKVGAEPAGLEQSLFLAPFGDQGVVAREQDFGNPLSAEFHGAGVLREFQNTCRKGVVNGGCLVSKNAGKQSHDCVDDDTCGKGAVGEHVVADGDFLIHKQVDCALVNAFIVPAKKDEVRGFLSEAFGGGVVKNSSGWG